MMEAKEAMENWNSGISELFSIICKKEEPAALVCDVEPLIRRWKEKVEKEKSTALKDYDVLDSYETALEELEKVCGRKQAVSSRKSKSRRDEP